MRDAGGREDASKETERSPARGTAIRHLVLGFGLLATILFTAALCGLPR